MDGVGRRLQKCRDCGRTFNKRVNSRCPACKTEIQQDEYN